MLWLLFGPKLGPKMDPKWLRIWSPKMGSAAQMCSWSPKWAQKWSRHVSGSPNMAPKWLQNVTLEPEMDTKMEPTCLQELPRGAPGAPSGPNMHPKWNAKGHGLRKFCISHHRQHKPPQLRIGVRGGGWGAEPIGGLRSEHCDAHILRALGFPLQFTPKFHLFVCV